MTKWFGEPWPSADQRAPVCADDADRVPTPVGKMCGKCEKHIWNGDQGVVIPGMGVQTPFHKDCFLEMIIGPIAAQVEENLRDG